MNTTTAEYSALDEAFDFYNAHLFDGRLPPCLITLQRKARALGYFSPDRFASRIVHNETTDEIALNPDTFDGRSDQDILSTLVHELVHLWQNKFGKPGRRGYHNKEWAAKMEQVGLMPTNTGEPDGKRTGQQMTHFIITGGPFDLVTQQLLATGFQLTWQSVDRWVLSMPGSGKRVGSPKISRERQTRNKTKYCCVQCGLNAWAKSDANLWCGNCQQTMHAQNIEHSDSGSPLMCKTPISLDTLAGAAKHQVGA